MSGEGFTGGGGSVVGAKAACVDDTTVEGTFGGIMKWMVSSLFFFFRIKLGKNIKDALTLQQ